MESLSKSLFLRTSVKVCVVPQSEFFSLTFLGLRFCSFASDREINGSVSTQVTDTSPIILPWPSNLVCLFLFFLERVIKSVPAPGILAQAISPFHTMFIS